MGHKWNHYGSLYIMTCVLLVCIKVITCMPLWHKELLLLSFWQICPCSTGYASLPLPFFFSVLRLTYVQSI